jgi:hypothetical protein
MGTMSKRPLPSKQASEPHQFKPGVSGNPGGLTALEREARDAIRQALAEPEMRQIGLSAYKHLLEEGNPLIVKDFVDRVAGKVKERVEVSGDSDNPLAPLLKAGTLAELLELVRSGK